MLTAPWAKRVILDKLESFARQVLNKNHNRPPLDGAMPLCVQRPGSPKFVGVPGLSFSGRPCARPLWGQRYSGTGSLTQLAQLGRCRRVINVVGML